MELLDDVAPLLFVALLAEGVDRNISAAMKIDREIRSPSSRRAWIEIAPGCRRESAYTVALLAEGVDRNALRANTI